MNRNFLPICLAATLLALLMAKAQESGLLSSIESEMQPCMDCHGLDDITKLDESGAEVSVFVDEQLLLKSAHATTSCFSCHSDVLPTHPDDEIKLKAVNCRSCHEEASATFDTSVHAEALRNGDWMAPSCVDCHGGHDVSDPFNLESPLHWTNLLTTCGECHPAQADDVNQSVHGAALAKNLREAPSCTDCHAGHRMEGLKSADPVYISRDVCSRCHDSERIATKFKMPTDRASTFFSSYHGLAAEFGLAKAANCASCHGYHLILPSSNPQSIIHPDNIVNTCGQCHPGANENFASSKVHVGVTGQADIGSMVNQWVRWIYLFLIAATIGFMLLHNGVVFVGKIRMSRRSQIRTHVRMDRNQRWQHGVLALSFIILAISGFALEYPNSALAWLMGSDEMVRRMVHRIAAVALLGTGAIHLLYLASSRNGRQLFFDFIPTFTDVKGLASNLKYWMCLKGTRPAFGRFSYVEKMEYWAVIWGSIIMGVTGFMLWLKMDVTTWLPRWIVDVAKTIHYYEAILAILAIVVWHFYHVFLDPGIYPMNTAWWNGKVPEDWYRKEHGLDPHLNGKPHKVAEKNPIEQNPKQVDVKATAGK